MANKHLGEYVTVFTLLLLLIVYTATRSPFTFDSTPQVPFLESFSSAHVIERTYQNRTLGCTVKLVETLDGKVPADTSQKTCSLQLLDDNFLATGQFHGEGTWYASNVTDPDETVEYVPSICSFTSTSTKTDKDRAQTIPECFKRKKIGKILVTGDSNGRHFKEELVRFLENINYSCKELRSSLIRTSGALEKNSSYLDVPGIEHGQLHLPGMMFARLAWAYRELQCTHPYVNNADMIVEFIHGPKIHDTSLYLSAKASGLNFEDRVNKADSKVEYLLKFYYPHHGFPDLWFIVPPYHNMAISTTTDVLRLNIRSLLGLLDIFLPETTHVVFFADATVCPDHNMENYVTDYRRHWNMTMDERINEMNQVLYEELAVELPRHSNYHVFLDATRVACPVTCTWHHDPAHMLPAWYYKMAEYSLNSACVD